jgi:hypothetical protein
MKPNVVSGEAMTDSRSDLTLSWHGLSPWPMRWRLLLARRGSARRGSAGQGSIGQGRPRRGSATLIYSGHGLVCPGRPRLGSTCLHFPRRGMAVLDAAGRGLATQGSARPGQARPGTAGLGMATLPSLGWVRQGYPWQGEARQGTAGLGMVRHGSAWLGYHGMYPPCSLRRQGCAAASGRPLRSPEIPFHRSALPLIALSDRLAFANL